MKTLHTCRKACHTLFSSFFVLYVTAIMGACTPARWTWHETSAEVRPDYQVCLEVSHPELEKAVQVWDHALGSWRRMHLSKGWCDIIVREGTCDDKEAIACADSLGGSVVTLVRGRYEGDRVGVLLHELGHILGAQHLEDTLMSAEYKGHYDCPDRETVAQVAAYQHANLTLFSWCWH